MVSTLQPNRSLNPGRHRFNYLCLARRSSAKENWKTLQSAAKINWIIIITTSKYAHSCKPLPQMCIFLRLARFRRGWWRFFFWKILPQPNKNVALSWCARDQQQQPSNNDANLYKISSFCFTMHAARTENMLQIASKADSPRRNRRVAVNKLLICL